MSPEKERESVLVPAPYGDRGPEIVADRLAPQLGSAPKYLEKKDHDMRILSVIEEKDIPFFIYAKLRAKKSKAWAVLFDDTLALRVSIGGRGRRDIIRMEAVSKGGIPSVEGEIPERPSWVERNVTNRSWRERVRRESI